MLVHNGWAREKGVALQLVRNLVGQHVYPVHRLDRGTSGVLVFALSSESASQLQRALSAPTSVKSYLALVRGICPEAGLVDHAIAKQPGGEKRAARTRFRRLGTFERYSLVLAQPLTGRLHQIRRHMKHLSHPLIGDVRYGKSEHNRLFRERFGLSRLALHALCYEFVHPVTGEQLALRASLPLDLSGPLAAMGLEERVPGKAWSAGQSWDDSVGCLLDTELAHASPEG